MNKFFVHKSFFIPTEISIFSFVWKDCSGRLRRFYQGWENVRQFSHLVRAQQVRLVWNRPLQNQGIRHFYGGHRFSAIILFISYIFNPPIQLRKNSANSTVTVNRLAFSAALDILSIIVFLLLIESLNLNFLLFLLTPFSSNTSTPKILKILRKQTIKIMNAQRNFEDIF